MGLISVPPAKWGCILGSRCYAGLLLSPAPSLAKMEARIQNSTKSLPFFPVLCFPFLIHGDSFLVFLAQWSAYFKTSPYFIHHFICISQKGGGSLGHPPHCCKLESPETSIQNISLWFKLRKILAEYLGGLLWIKSRAQLLMLKYLHCSFLNSPESRPAPLRPAYLVSFGSYGCHPNAHAYIFTLCMHQKV